MFDGIILNASGPRCTTDDELINLDKSKSGWVLTKSCTLEHRDGNASPRYYDNDLGSINSMGLPNNGIDYYIECALEIKKPYYISVCGLTLDENIIILDKILNAQATRKIDGIELNLSCPNVIGKGQLGYDFEQIHIYLSKVFEMIKPYTKINIGVKLPPYFEISHFDTVGTLLDKFDIKFITCVNSIGNGLIIDPITEKTQIKPKMGCGGIGGTYIKPTGLSNVWNFYNVFKKLNSPIKIIGCGGVSSGMDAFEYILCGATAVQIGTQFYKEDIKCFKRINAELQKIMKNKKYKHFSDFRGKLNIL